ncbi:cell division protein FtsH, partial [mine drainage metagenome]
MFLGRSVTQHKLVSDVTAHAIDEEVRRVIENNYKTAREILTASLDKLHTMAEALIKYETIEDDQLKDIMAGREPKPPSGWDDTMSHRPPPPAPGPLPWRPARLARELSTSRPGLCVCPSHSTLLRCGGRSLDWASPTVMGVINVTPDSFSDGGRY